MFFRNLVFLHSSLPFRSFVQQGARIRKEQNPCKEWEEVGLQCSFWKCSDTFQWTYSDFLQGGLFTGELPVLSPCLSRHPYDCSIFPFLFLPIIVALPGSTWSSRAGCDTDLVLQFYISCLCVSVSWDTYHYKMPQWKILLAYNRHKHAGDIFSLATMRW